jgi:hypothetical protein
MKQVRICGDPGENGTEHLPNMGLERHLWTNLFGRNCNVFVSGTNNNINYYTHFDCMMVIAVRARQHKNKCRDIGRENAVDMANHASSVMKSGLILFVGRNIREFGIFGTVTYTALLYKCAALVS